MKNLIVLFALALSTNAFAAGSGDYIVTAQGTDGMTAVSCHGGSPSGARMKALTAASNYCAQMGGYLIAGTDQEIASGCGRGGSIVASCPHVCQSQIQVKCRVP